MYYNVRSIEKYRYAGALGLQNAMEYRADYLAGMIGIFLPILIQFFVWSAVYDGKAADEIVFGYTFAQMMIYSFSAGFIAKLTGTGFHYEVSNDIKNGNLSKFLVQPVKYIHFRAACFFGGKIIETCIVFTLMILLQCIIAPVLGLKIEIVNILIFIIDIFPAFCLTFLAFFCVSLTAFWIVEVSHVYGVIDILVAIASGTILPLDIFGEKVLLFMNYLPFTYTTYFLTNILSGKLDMAEIIKGMALQLVWIVILYAADTILWKMGTKKYVAVGG